jgi:ubiquinone/menaquinone biosynthesis C-methylase UbiE
MNIFLNESIANSYDEFYVSASGRNIDQLEKQQLKIFLDKVPVQSVLELGCGTGHWTEFLSSLGFSVTALDVSEAMLRIARQKNIPNAKILNADASSLPFEDNSIGLVFTITMLEFVQDIQKVLAEIFRVLQPGGTLIVGCLNINSTLGKNKNEDETFREAHFFSTQELHLLLSKFGEPEIKECIHMNSFFELMDGKEITPMPEGIFLAASVKKTIVNL